MCREHVIKLVERVMVDFKSEATLAMSAVTTTRKLGTRLVKVGGSEWNRCVNVTAFVAR